MDKRTISYMYWLNFNIMIFKWGLNILLFNIITIVFSAIRSSNYETTVDLIYKYGTTSAGCSDNFNTKLTNELPRFQTDISTLCNVTWTINIETAEAAPGIKSQVCCFRG